MSFDGEFHSRLTHCISLVHIGFRRNMTSRALQIVCYAPMVFKSQTFLDDVCHNRRDATKLGVTELPGSLAESLIELEKDEVLKSALGPTLYEAYMRAKWEEWDEFRLHVTDYEITKYLETAWFRKQFSVISFEDRP